MARHLNVPGEKGRLDVRGRRPAGPAGRLGPMALRASLVLVLLGVVALGVGPARAVEGAKPAVSGMNPGPFPKAAPPKPPAPKAGVATKPVETTGVIEPRTEPAKPAEPVQVAEIKAPEPEAPKPAPKPPAYCASIADAAADARFAWQKEQLSLLEKQVEERIARLEAKRAEYETWLARRDAFLAKADEGVVAIYTKMRADAAALQLANMPNESAAAILTKLNARTASAILSEMEAARAAQLARTMGEMGKSESGKSESGKSDPGKKTRESEKS